MVSKYTIIFAFFALFALQSANGLNIQRNDARGIADLIKKAEAAIERLAKNVQEAVQKAIHKIEDINKNILDKGKNIIEKAKAEIAEIIQDVKIQMQHMKEEAEKLGVDVRKCLIENEAELERIPKSIVDKLIECINDEINKAKQILSDIVNEIVAIKDEISQLPGNMKDCLASGNIVSCLTNLVTDIISKLTSIPANIQQKIIELKQLISNIQTDLQKCALQKIIQTSKEAAAVGAKVATCVAHNISA